MNDAAPAEVAAWLWETYGLRNPVTKEQLIAVAIARGITILHEPQLEQPAEFLAGRVRGVHFAAIALRPDATARHVLHELLHACARASREGSGELAHVDTRGWTEHGLARAVEVLLCGDEERRPEPEPEPYRAPRLVADLTPRAWYAEELFDLFLRHGAEVLDLGERYPRETWADAREALACLREAFGD